MFHKNTFTKRIIQLYMKKLSLLFFIFHLLISSCKSVTSYSEKETQQLYKTQATQIKIDSTTAKNKRINDFIKPFKTHLNNELDAVLCTTPINLTRTDGKLESSLGNLMADICYSQGNPKFKNKTSYEIDFVLLNYGGIRAAIPKGNITARNAFEVMPFENEMIIVELTGEKVKELLTYLTTQKKAHPIANIRLELKNNNYQNVTINNKPFKVIKNYFVLTSDYLQQGGDKMYFFKNPVSLHKIDYKIRNALIDYFKKATIITPNLDNRFSNAK